MAKRLADPSDVRAWARENGLTVGTRGRFQPEVIEAFNRAHSNKRYVPAGFVRTITVQGVRTTDSGRRVPIRKNATYADIRAAAQAAGVELGKRGRVKAEVLSAYAAGELVPA